MKIGGIYLINYFSLTFVVIKILKIKNEYIYYEVINIHNKIYGKGYQSLHALEQLIIKPLNKKEWYKLIRRSNEKR